MLPTYMRCVESGVQSGRYLAPISRAFSLSSPLKGFWKPLRTNTTPSIIRLNGTCCAPWDLAFCCLGAGWGLDWLSRFLSADFCAGEAGETIAKVREVLQVRKLSVRFRHWGKCYLSRRWGLACWLGSACVWGSQLCPQVSQLGSFSSRAEGQRQTAALCWTQIFFLLVAMRKQLM